MKLTRDQLYTLGKATEVREASLGVYAMDADDQCRVWQFETNRAREFGDQTLSQDRWLVDVVRMIDTIQPSAELYLVDPEIEVKEHFGDALELPQDPPRIVLGRELVGFFSHGAHSAVLYLAGTSRYMGMTEVWVPEALGMLACSRRPARSRPVGSTERHALHRAHYRPRRDFYFVPNVSYPAVKREARGGHHASPVAHDRAAHRALLTRVGVESDNEVQDLIARQYTIAMTEDLPPEIVERMVRRGKQPIPGTRNAYRWIDKSGSRVNPDGELARRVTLIRPTTKEPDDDFT